MRKLLFIIGLFYLSQILWSQSGVYYESGYRIERFMERDGVLKSEIVGILEDSKGYLWFANVDYLLKYDGYEFKKYKPEKAQLLEGAANYFRQLAEDKEGNIWISTFFKGGILRFNPTTEVFTRIINKDNNSPLLVRNNVNNIVLDTLGDLWFGDEYGPTKIETNGAAIKTTPYFVAELSLAFINFIDSLKTKEDLVIEEITKVRNAQNVEKIFKITKPTNVLLINVGENGIVAPNDYGYIETLDGKVIWSFDVEKSIYAGGVLENRIQVDTLQLPIGT